MRRAITVLLAAVLGLGSPVIVAQPAAANITLGKGWAIWTREYCEDGSFVHMRRLSFTGRGTQGREYVYRRNGRLCAFVVDHMAGSHWIDVTARHQKSWRIDSGYYTEYAGAVAGPAGKCIQVLPSLQIRSGGEDLSLRCALTKVLLSGPQVATPRSMTASDQGADRSGVTDATEVDQLARAFAAVEALIARIRAEQWSAATPCREWTVRQLVDHLIGMNRVFIALLDDEPMPMPMPRPTGPGAEADPAAAFGESAAALLAAFDRPGVLERTCHGRLGAATGSERLQIRMYDLLAHGWDLAQATEQPAAMPEDLAEQALPSPVDS